MKLFLWVLFLVVPSLAHATTRFTISGGPNIVMHCDVPFGGGECVQYYDTDQGYLHITVNGVQFTNFFDAEPRSTAGFVGQEFADEISSYFGVSVTVTPLDGWDIDHVANSQFVSIEINGNYTLSDAQTEETNPNFCASCSVWHISY